MTNKAHGRLTDTLAEAGKRTLQWLAALAGFFAWWTGMLLLFSLVLVNVWHVSFGTILLLSAGLTFLSGIAYAAVMILRARRAS